MNRILLSAITLLFGAVAFAQTPTPVVITATSVIASAKAQISEATAGDTITQGNLLYLDANSRAVRADADASAASAEVVGMALSSSVSGAKVRYVTYDPELTPGGTLVVGEIYAASSTPGGFTTISTPITGNYTSVIGIATSTTKMLFNPMSSGAQVP